MTQSKKDTPAFPTVSVFVDASNSDEPSGTTISSSSEGMTLRDYFAAKAMQGFTSQAGKMPWGAPNMAAAGDFTDTAEAAYKMADAMMIEGSK